MKSRFYLFIILVLFLFSEGKSETLIVEINSEIKAGPVLMAVYNEK